MTESGRPVLARARPFWLVIVGAGAIISVNMGIRQTFGLFLGPISLDLGLGRESFALSMGLLNLVWGLSAPFAGAIADKYGAGRVVAVGAAIYISGIYMMSTASGQGELLTAGVIIGLGVSGTGFTAVLGAVGRAAPEEKRSMALGLASMGGSIGQFLALPYTHVLIDNFGWVSSLVVLAATATLMAPLGWLISGKPQSETGQSSQTLRQAIGEAIRHPGFLLLTAGFFVCGFHIVFIAVHLPSFLSDKGFGPEMGTAALTMIGFTNILGTYTCGRLGERMEKRTVLSMLYFARALVFVALLLMPLNTTTVLMFAAAIGFLWLGTVPLTSGLVATLFGPRWMSMLFGIVFLSHQLGSFLGAWLGGYLYDIFRSYDAMWWISIGLALVAMLLHLQIRERPVPRLASAPVRSQA
ncbi:putative MFS-type transporter YhjX [bacterium MnTg02]|nr:putative MFS-type transporter YhjX [bacterium MnTg02]